MKRFLIVLFLLLPIIGCDGGIGTGFMAKLIPEIIFKTSSTSMEVGESILLTWSSKDAEFCNASGVWSGTKSLSGSERVMVSTPGNNEYRLTCGGKSSEMSVATLLIVGERTFSGKVIDGYIRGATVFIDKNNNLVNDVDEPFIITDNEGAFKLNYDNGNLISSGGFDLDTGNPMDTLIMSLPLSGYAEFKTITPLTSLIKHMQNPSILNLALGVDKTIDLTKTDPIALKDQGEPYLSLYEKGNQVAIFALGLQVYISQLNGVDGLAVDAFNSIATIIESEYLATDKAVNIEDEQYINGVIEHFIDLQFANNNITMPSPTSLSNLKTIMSKVIPILGFKETDYLSNALVNFATSTFSTDIKSIANNSFDEIRLNAYKDNVINYIASDQSVDPLGLISLYDNTVFTSDIDITNDVSEDQPGIGNITIINYQLSTDDTALPINFTNMVSNEDGSLTFDLFVDPSLYSYAGLSGIDLSILFDENDLSIESDALELNIDGISIINDKKADQIRLFWASDNGINILEDSNIGSLTIIPRNITDQTRIILKSVLFGGSIGSIDSVPSRSDDSRYQFVFSSNAFN